MLSEWIVYGVILQVPNKVVELHIMVINNVERNPSKYCMFLIQQVLQPILQKAWFDKLIEISNEAHQLMLILF